MCQCFSNYCVVQLLINYCNELLKEYWNFEIGGNWTIIGHNDWETIGISIKVQVLNTILVKSLLIHSFHQD